MSAIVDPLEAARTALAALHQGKPWAYRDGSEDPIDDAVGVGPKRLVLTSHYEERGVRYRIRKRMERSEHEQPAPDPWHVELVHAFDAAVDSEISQELDDVEVVRRCPTCGDSKWRNCGSCGGSGETSSYNASTGSTTTSSCGACGGSGSLHCGKCDEGIFYGRPTVWSRIREVEVVRVLESTELPLEVLFDVMDGDDGGVVLAEQSARPRIERFEPPATHGGYRDAARKHDTHLTNIAAEMLAEPNVPDDARLRYQCLETTMVPAWAVRFASGSEVVLYGDPPKCHPSTALRTPLYWLVRSLPYLFFALCCLGAVLFYLHWRSSG